MRLSFCCRSASSFFAPNLNREAPAAGPRLLFGFGLLLRSSRSDDSSTAAVYPSGAPGMDRSR